MLTSPVGHVGKREWVALISDRFSHTRIRRVVVIAHYAERISTALRTDRRSAVSALRHGRLAARHIYVAASGYEAESVRSTEPPSAFPRRTHRYLPVLTS